MLQLIVMAQLKDGSDPAPILDVLRRMPETVTTIRRAELRPDLGLTKHLGHNATFTWIVDFDDQDGWQVYRDSPEHEVFANLLKPSAEQYLATQSEVK